MGQRTWPWAGRNEKVLTVTRGSKEPPIRGRVPRPIKERIMYTSQVVSHAQSPAPISRRVALSVVAAVVAVALTVLVLTLTTGTSTTHAGSATPSPAPSLRFSLSHIKGLDTAPSPNATR